MIVNIVEILNNINIDINYSKINIVVLMENVNNVNINFGYFDVYLGYDINYIFDFDIIIKYGNIKKDNFLDILLIENKFILKKISGYYKKKG